MRITKKIVEDSITVGCPHCGAKPRQACSTPNGKSCGTHSTRVSKYADKLEAEKRKAKLIEVTPRKKPTGKAAPKVKAVGQVFRHTPVAPAPAPEARYWPGQSAWPGVSALRVKCPACKADAGVKCTGAITCYGRITQFSFKGVPA